MGVKYVQASAALANPLMKKSIYAILTYILFCPPPPPQKKTFKTSTQSMRILTAR